MLYKQFGRKNKYTNSLKMVLESDYKSAEKNIELGGGNKNHYMYVYESEWEIKGRGSNHYCIV